VENIRSENKKYILILLALLSIVLIVFSIIFYFVNPLEIRVITVTYLVGETPGFDLNTSALTFGMIPPGGSSTRSIIIENDHEFPIKVDATASRNIVNLLDSHKTYYIGIDGRVKIPFTLRVPSDHKNGNFTGKVKFEIRKK